MQRPSSFKSGILLFIRAFLVLAFLFTNVLTVTIKQAEAAPSTLERISENNLPNDYSFEPSISGNDFVVFYSGATNYLDLNGVEDEHIYFYNTDTGDIELISQSQAGVIANGSSNFADVSTNGRYVVFSSNATNLTADVDDLPGSYDIFLKDRQTGEVERISNNDLGVKANGLSRYPTVSDDGNIVAYQSTSTNLFVGDTNTFRDTYVYNRTTNQVVRVSSTPANVTGNGNSNEPKVSSDGQFVLFDSSATNFGVTGGVYLYEIATDTMTAIAQGFSTSSSLSTTPSSTVMSDDNRYIVFYSSANNIVPGDTNNNEDIFVYDRTDNDYTRVSVTSLGGQATGTFFNAAISGDGEFVAYATDSQDLIPGVLPLDWNIVMYEMDTGITSLVSKSSGGVVGNGYSDGATLSSDGSKIVYYSEATNIVEDDVNDTYDIYVYDVATDTNIMVGGDGAVYAPSGGYRTSNSAVTSEDGSIIVFDSQAENLIVGCGGSSRSHIVVYDTNSDEFECLTSAVTASTSNINPAVSADGRYVTFSSNATVLIPGDTNGLIDIYVYDRQTDVIERVSVADGGVQAVGGTSVTPSISADGNLVAFSSAATNLVAGDVNGVSDIFVYNRTTDTIERIQAAGVTTATLPAISADGTHVAFAGLIGGLTQIIVYNLNDDTFENITATGSASSNTKPSISEDGSIVAFASTAPNLVVGDTNGVADAFVYDRDTDVMEIISLDTTAGPANGASYLPKLSWDGLKVVFGSAATDLVASDTNGVADVFYYDRNTDVMNRIHETVSGTQANSDTISHEISPDGNYAVFASRAGNLIEYSTGTTYDVFLAGLAAPVTPPTVTTAAASGIAATAATLNGEITDIGSDTPTERGFEYGIDMTYGTTVSDVGTFSTGVFNEVLAGLTCNTLYHFRAFATSPDGTGNGSDQTFTTSACAGGGGGGGGGGGSSSDDDDEDEEQPIIPVVPPVILPIPTIIPPVAPVTPPTTPPATTSDDQGDGQTNNEEPPAGDNPVITPPSIPLEQDQRPTTPPSNNDGRSSQSGPSFWANTFSLKSYREAMEPITALTATNLALLMLMVPIAAGATPLAAAATAGLGLGIAGLQLLYTRYFQDLLSFLGLRKKRRVWGTVYDSQTKQPLDPAVVELVDAETGEVKEQAITDLAGRFGFLATNGTFMLRASKTHYAFPSIKETSNKDEIFENLYHGEKLTLTEGSTLVAPNIPMDPEGYDWNQDAKQKLLPSRLRLQYLIQIVFNILFAVGFGFALINAFLFPGWWNTIVLALYFVVLILRILLGRKHLWGRLTKNGQAMSGAYLELTESQMGIVMGKSLTAIDGKFFLKTPQPGQYNLSIKASPKDQPIWQGQVTVGKDSVFNEELAL